MSDVNDELLAIVKKCCQELRVHFDSVQIIATVHDNDEAGTSSIAWGSGNYYARRDSVRDWVMESDAVTDEKARLHFRQSEGDAD